MSHPHLTFPENVFLASVDVRTGKALPIPPLGYRYALAGAVIAELAWAQRIDTDPGKLFVLDAAPTGDPAVDWALTQLAEFPEPRPVAYWLRRFSVDYCFLQAAAADRLVACGVLRRVEQTVLWVFDEESFPTVDDRARVEVRQRLTHLIENDELPDPREAALLGLLVACRLAEVLFPKQLLAGRAARIATLVKFDLVGREVAAALRRLAEAADQAAAAKL